MLRNFALAASIITVTSPAFAGGLSEPIVAPQAAVPAPVAPAPVQSPTRDWSGFYAGGQAGTIVNSEETYPGGITGEVEGNLYGVHAGYMFDTGRVVLGAELDYDLLNINEVSLSGPTGSVTESVDEDGSITRLGLRAGFDAGRSLPYLTAGFASISLAEFDELDGTTGSFFGGGLMFGATENILLSGQVLQHAFDTDVDTQITTVSLRASYKF